jgi:hypothetical protein
VKYGTAEGSSLRYKTIRVERTVSNWNMGTTLAKIPVYDGRIFMENIVLLVCKKATEVIIKICELTAIGSIGKEKEVHC